jgi:hypothetical protein
MLQASEVQVHKSDDKILYYHHAWVAEGNKLRHIESCTIATAAFTAGISKIYQILSEYLKVIK